MIPILFQKAQNPGYTRKDGTYVRPYNDRRATARIKAVPDKRGWPFSADDQVSGFDDLFDDQATTPKAPSCAMTHPKLDENGKPKTINYPSSPTSAATWVSPTDAAVFTPGCPVPAALNGVVVAPWLDAPAEDDDWDFVEGQNDDLTEPPLKLAVGKKPASGVIVQEPDGRVWIIGPTNRYGGVMHTFPKGGREPGLSLQANAIKEAYEESGLKVEIDSFAMDVVRSTSMARYYLAHRVGGSPADMGWESQSVRLVPLAQLGDYLNRPEDREILEFLRDQHPKNSA